MKKYVRKLHLHVRKVRESGRLLEFILETHAL